MEPGGTLYQPLTLISKQAIQQTSMSQKTSLQAMQERAAGHRAHNQMVLRKLMLFTVLMFAVPIGTFYGVKRFIVADSPYADAWSGSAAVVMVNVVIGLYVASAWAEDDEPEVAPPVGRFAKRKAQ